MAATVIPLYCIISFAMTTRDLKEMLVGLGCCSLHRMRILMSTHASGRQTERCCRMRGAQLCSSLPRCTHPVSVHCLLLDLVYRPQICPHSGPVCCLAPLCSCSMTRSMLLPSSKACAGTCSSLRRLPPFPHMALGCCKSAVIYSSSIFNLCRCDGWCGFDAASERSESSAVVGRADHIMGAHETFIQVSSRVTR